MTTFQETPLLIEKPAYGGDCITHLPHSGGKRSKPVFVPLTLPGETVSARVVYDRHNFTRTELEEVLEASPNRVQPSCPHFGVCGGCHYQHANYPTQLDLKRQVLHETLNRAGVKFPTEIAILFGNPWEYRNRIRLAMTINGQIGYRSRRSNEIIPIGECPISAPVLIQTAKVISEFQRETHGLIEVSELDLFTNQDESEILVQLIATKGESYPDTGLVQSWLEALRVALPLEASGLWLKSGDSALSTSRLGAGLESLNYCTAGFDYQVNQGAFFQANRWLLDDFVSLVTRGQSGDSAWDLFAGVGLFAVKLTESFQRVMAIESSLESQQSLAHNLAHVNAVSFWSTTVDFLRHNRIEREPCPDLIILDPPRAGLSEETTTLLNAVGAPEMVYVSCDPTTLARDLRALTSERYCIKSVNLVDMFSQTFHLETVVRLSRV